MYDALDDLADASLTLHRPKADITLPVAHHLLIRQTEVFAARKESSGHYYAEACQAVDAPTCWVYTCLMWPNKWAKFHVNLSRSCQS